MNIPTDTGKESWGALAIAGFLIQLLDNPTGTRFDYAVLGAVVILVLAAGAGRLYMKTLKFRSGLPPPDKPNIVPK